MWLVRSAVPVPCSYLTLNVLSTTKTNVGQSENVIWDPGPCKLYLLIIPQTGRLFFNFWIHSFLLQSCLHFCIIACCSDGSASDLIETLSQSRSKHFVFLIHTFYRPGPALSAGCPGCDGIIWPFIWVWSHLWVFTQSPLSSLTQRFTTWIK